MFQKTISILTRQDRISPQPQFQYNIHHTVSVSRNKENIGLFLDSVLWSEHWDVYFVDFVISGQDNELFSQWQPTTAPKPD